MTPASEPSGDAMPATAALSLAEERAGPGSAAVGSAAEPTLPTVLLAGFGGAIAAGLCEVITRHGGLHVLGDSGERDLGVAIGEQGPDVAFVNEEALRGALQLRRLTCTYPDTGLVVAAARLSHERVEILLGAGARVVVPRDLKTVELCLVLRLVAQGLVGPPRPRSSRPSNNYGSLTAREVEVLELLLRDGSVGDIAGALQVTVATVHTHRQHIYDKLGVHSRHELNRAAQRLSGPSHLGRRAPAPLAGDRLAFRRRPRIASIERQAVAIRNASSARHPALARSLVNGSESRGLGSHSLG